MTTVIRLRTTALVLGAVAAITSAFVWGDNTGSKPNVGGTLNPSGVKLNDNLLANRFAKQTVVVYETQAGETLFALQVKPDLKPAGTPRPHDIVFVVDTSASQSGKYLTTARTVIEQTVKKLGSADRVSIWVANTPRATRNLSGGLKDPNHANCTTAINTLKTEYPSGATDLRNAVEQSLRDFDGKTSRQQVIVYIGDAESAFEPLAEKDRYILANKVREARVQFFAVSLGVNINGLNMHSLVTGTGGSVVRFSDEINDQNKASDHVATNLFKAFDVPVIVPTKFELNAEVAELYPTKLPPLRGDAPTLVVGRFAKGKVPARLEATISGRIGAAEAQANVSEAVPAADVGNFMLASMVRQWSESNAKEAPSILRADRALALAYEQSRLSREEYLTQAQWALGANQVETARQLANAARQIDSSNPEVKTLITVLDRIATGELTLEALKAATKNRIGVSYEKGPNGLQLVRHNLEEAQDNQPKQNDNPLVPGGNAADLLKAEQARRAILEQQVTNTIQESIQRGRELLRSGDPKSAKDLILAQRDSVRANRDIGDALRDKLANQLELLLTDIGQRGDVILRAKAEETERIARARAKLMAQETEVAKEERNRQRVRAFTQLMQQARYEDAYREALVMMQEAVNEGSVHNRLDFPLEAQAVYQMGQAATNLREMRELTRIREDRFLLSMMQVEKSHIPYPDEPPVHFPPSKVWKDLLQLRKKYAVQDFDGDMPARQRRRWNFLKSALDSPVTIKEKENTLGLLLTDLADQASGADKDRDPAKKVTIVLDLPAFAEAAGGKFEPEVFQIKFPTPLQGISLATALRLITEQLPAKRYSATYVVRPDYIELLPGEKALADKVVRAFPVEELIFDIPNSVNANSLQQNLSVLGGQFQNTFFGIQGGVGGFNVQGFNAQGGPGAGQGGGGANNLFQGQGIAGFGGGVQGQFGNLGGQFGLQGNNQDNGMYLVSMIAQLVDPGRWKTIALYNQMNMMGMDPNMDMGVPAQEYNTIGYYPPARALIIQGTTRFQRGTNSRLRPKEMPVNFAPNNQVNAGNNNGGNIAKADPKANPGKMEPANEPNPAQIAQMKRDPEAFFTDLLSKASFDPGVVIASVDFLAKAGEYKYVAEVLKAALRSGLVAEAWAHEALAIALEASNGAGEEIERARVSGIDLEPKNPQAYLKASRALADAGDADRALKFCRAAAKIEPNLPDPYINALAFAAEGKATLDARDSVFFSGNLLERDWAVDAADYHLRAREHLKNTAAKLTSQNKMAEARTLQEVLDNEKRRDIVIRLRWQGAADVDLKVREPIGTVCSSLSKLTAGGGVLLCDDFTQKDDARTETYSAAESFDGSFEITVDAVWGAPLGNKVLIEVIRHQGTPQQEIQLYNLVLPRDPKAPRQVKMSLAFDGGRRKSLASVPPPAIPVDAARKPEREQEAIDRIRALSSGVSNMTSMSGGTGAAGKPTQFSAGAQPEAPLTELAQFTTVNPIAPGGIELRQQKVVSKDGKKVHVQVAPVFETASTRQTKTKLDFLPGGE
jgi:tetratricopeptide (TPR) repeat protein